MTHDTLIHHENVDQWKKKQKQKKKQKNKQTNPQIEYANIFTSVILILRVWTQIL